MSSDSTLICSPHELNSDAIFKKSILRNESIRDRSAHKRVVFDVVDVYYFERIQGFNCVPCQGGSTLGMEAIHTTHERLSLNKFQAKRKLERREYLCHKYAQGKINLSNEQFSMLRRFILKTSSETSADNSSSEEECIRRLEEIHLFNAIPAKKRKFILKRSGVLKIDHEEKDECEEIRLSRTVCGCDCPNGLCYPETCQCALNGIPCQVDRASFPCSCMIASGCVNPVGRIKFDPARAKTHFLHTTMRLEMEQRQLSDTCIINTRKRLNTSNDSKEDEEEDSDFSQGDEEYNDDEDKAFQKKRRLFFSQSSDSGLSSLDSEKSLSSSTSSIEDENERFLANYNTTLSGGCRDCQNDRLVSVLMNEWRYQHDVQSPASSSSSSSQLVLDEEDEEEEEEEDDEEEEHNDNSCSLLHQSQWFDNKIFMEHHTSDSLGSEETSCTLIESPLPPAQAQQQQQYFSMVTCKLDPISCFLPQVDCMQPQNLEASSTTFNHLFGTDTLLLERPGSPATTPVTSTVSA